MNLLSAQDEKKTYLPILGEGIKFYFTTEGGTDAPNIASYFECNKDVENKNIYHIVDGNYDGNIDYYLLETSEDNSKLWGRHHRKPEVKILLMDLDLNVGDKFKGFTVAKVYQKDERKYIEFEELFYGSLHICVDEHKSIDKRDIPLTFIEGIGPNYFMEGEYYKDGEFYPFIWPPVIWIYARHKNGAFEYGIDGYPPRWFFDPSPIGYGGEWCSTCEKGTGLHETKINSLLLYPNPSGDKVQVKLPETIAGEAVLTISDLSGREIETVTVNNNPLVLDISRYAPAIYIAKLSANNCQYVGKIIKK